MTVSLTHDLRRKPAAVLALAARALLVAALLMTAAGAAFAAPRSLATERTAAQLIIENVGQFAPQARFAMPVKNGAVWLTDDGVWLAVTTGTTRQFGVRFTFQGANTQPALEPFGRIAAGISYLNGSDPAVWRTDVPAWAGVRYHDLYPGIDLVVGDGASGAVPWRLEARPGADLAAVSLRVEGAAATAADGKIALDLGGQPFQVNAPDWGATPGAATPAAEGAFTLAPTGPAEAAPQQAAPDAGDLLFSVTTGGSALDAGYGVAVDFAGNSYVTGETQSNNFPTLGAYDNSANGGTDAFVVRYDTAGTLQYATYLGGSAEDIGWGIAVENGIAYVVGETASANFPVIGALVAAKDIFVAALAPSGNALRYVTRIGGTDADYGYGIAVENGLAYIVGESDSNDLAGTGCSTGKGGDLVAAKIGATGAVAYTTCLGGTSLEVGYGVAVRNTEAYVTGQSFSGDFPGNLVANSGDILVARLNSAGAVAASTLVGGSGEDAGHGVAVDSAGSVYLAGVVGDSTPHDFPVTTSTAYAGGLSDGVVVQLSNALAVSFATYLGGADEDYAYGLSLDTVNGIYVGGTTLSANFRTTPGAYATASGGGFDAFATRLQLSAAAADKVTYSTYLPADPAAQDQQGFSADTDTGGNAFVAGAMQTSINPASAGSQLWNVKVSSPPAAPSATISLSGANVTLSWNAVTGATSYQVIRSETPYRKPNNTSLFLSRAGQGATTQLDSNVPTTSNYYYVIKGVNNKPEAGPNSNQVGKFTFTLVKGG